jgi:hypothetical protein
MEFRAEDLGYKARVKGSGVRVDSSRIRVQG